MNDPEIISRFEELDAGRILGDLDAGEMDEWEKLARDPRCQSDLSLELAAAALEPVQWTQGGATHDLSAPRWGVRPHRRQHLRHSLSAHAALTPRAGPRRERGGVLGMHVCP